MTSSAQAVLDALTAALSKAGDNVKRTYGDTRRLGQEVGNYLYSALDKAGREVAAPALQRQADLFARAGTGPVLGVGDDGQLTGRLADLAELVTSGMAGPVPGGALGAGPAILPKVVTGDRNALAGVPTTANNALLSSADAVVNSLMPGDFFSRKAAAIPPSYHAAQRPLIEDPIRVYHGSPHDFTPELEVVDAAGRARFYSTQQPLPEEVQQGILSGQLTMREHPYGRFSLDKIGTGEGAQAYGHGLYFAEHEPVAKGYRDELSYGWKYGNNIYNKAYFDRYDYIDQIRGKVARALAYADEHVLKGSQPNSIENFINTTPKILRDAAFENYGVVPFDDEAWRQRQLFLDAANTISGLKSEKLSRLKGHMYAANLHARPEQFLDWDRPLAQQPESIQEIINSTVGPTRRLRNPSIGDIVNYAAYSSPYENYPALGSKEAFSEVLRSAGIPGIRYLDQGSRSLGDGTSNYVVFDPNIIEIARKYALPAALAGSGAYMMSNPAEAAPFTPPQGWFDVNNPRPPRPYKAPLPPEQGYSYPPGEYIEPPPRKVR